MSRLFDAVDDVINCTSNLDDPEPMTITAWVFATGAGENSENFIVNKGASGTSSGRWTFEIDNSGGTRTDALRFFKNYSTTNLSRFSANSAITRNAWQHVAVSWDGSSTATNIKLYVNGTEVTYDTTTNGVGTKNSDAALAILIGNDLDTKRTFQGRISDVEIHSGVLSVNQIRQLMRFPGSIAGSSSKLFCPLWGGSPEPDYSGNGNHGTVTGATVSADNPPINGVFRVPKPELIHVF